MDALLIDPDHPRQTLPDEAKAWCQQTHTECLLQIAVFPQGREVLCQDPAVRDALRVVAERGLTEDAQNYAESALLALSDTELQVTEGQKHVMLSCESLPICTISPLVVGAACRASDNWLCIPVLQTNGMCKK
jgi:hypothetical protein